MASLCVERPFDLRCRCPWYRAIAFGSRRWCAPLKALKMLHKNASSHPARLSFMESDSFEVFCLTISGACLRRTAMLPGALSLRLRAASSRKDTPKCFVPSAICVPRYNIALPILLLAPFLPVAAISAIDRLRTMLQLQCRAPIRQLSPSYEGAA